MMVKIFIFFGNIQYVLSAIKIRIFKGLIA